MLIITAFITTSVQQCGISILASAALLVSLYEHLFSGVQQMQGALEATKS